MKKRIFLIVLILCVLAIDVAYGQGCSQCKLVSEQSTEAGEASFATNINKGILLLMSMPYIILLIVFRKRIVRFVKQLFSPAANAAK
jgi:hypothetical protein